MHRRPLGTSTLKVSPIILGTWAIGGWMWGGTDEKKAIEAIVTSIEHGITTIDTAAVYGMGMSETLVGKAIKGRRDKVTIATKCGMRWDSDEGSMPFETQDNEGHPMTVRRNSKPESIFWECDQSLKRLGTDVIDLYQIHWPDATTPIEDSWGAMVRLLEQGKVRAIGVSNYNIHQLEKAHAIYPVHSLQSPYSLMRRGIEDTLLPFCQNNNIALLAYSPLERGLLSGKIKDKRHFSKGDNRAEHPTFSHENRQKVLLALDTLRPIAKRHHATFAQLILNCTAHMPGITAALAGARNEAQALENAASLAFQLTSEEKMHIVSVFCEEDMQLE